MAYCGVLDGLYEIGGKPVDLSRLDEGIIIAGDEEYNADEFISGEEELEVFNETALRTQNDLLKDIDSLLGKIAEKSGKDSGHSSVFYDRYTDLVVRFRDRVKESTFPNNLEDWWRYEYEVRESGITLFLNHIDYFSVCRDDSVDENIDTSFELFRVRSKLLTVEEYAESYGVTVTTVRQWIRRGKIRTAIKAGSEWRIPELAEIMSRGYQHGHYTRREHLSDLPEEYAFFNMYDFVDIEQNKENKSLFDLCFSRKFAVGDYPDAETAVAENCMYGQMDLKEREKFELYLIANPFVETYDSCIALRG